MQIVLAYQSFRTGNYILECTWDYVVNKSPISRRPQTPEDDFLELSERIARFNQIARPSAAADRWVAGLHIARTTRVMQGRLQNQEFPLLRRGEIISNGLLIVHVSLDDPQNLGGERRDQLMLLVIAVQNFVFDSLSFNPAPLTSATRVRENLALVDESTVMYEFNNDQLTALSQRIKPEELLELPLIPDELQNDPVLSQWKCAITGRCIRYPVYITICGTDKHYLCEKSTLERYKPFLGCGIFQEDANILMQWCGFTHERYKPIPGLHCYPRDVLVISRCYRPFFEAIERRLERISKEMAQQYFHKEVRSHPGINVVGRVCMGILSHLAKVHERNQEIIDNIGVRYRNHVLTINDKKAVAYNAASLAGTYFTISCAATLRIGVVAFQVFFSEDSREYREFHRTRLPTLTLL